MATEYTAHNVEQAVKQFYLNPSLQSEVHIWLTGAQISPAAWSFCWDLMGPDKGIEVQYYGASCLHVKIVRFWHEIPPEQFESLKSKLLETIVHFATGPKVILTRLCVGLSALILQLLPQKWPDAIQHLISTFQQEGFASLPTVTRCQILLEVLTVLPEEFYSTNLSQQRRLVLRQELNKGLDHVIPLLQSLLTPESPLEVYQMALKAFSRWVDFGLAMDRAEPIIHQVFTSLRNPQLFDIAADTLSSVFAHPESYKYPVTIQRILSDVLSLHDMFSKALADEDKETCEGICRVVVSLSENHTKLIVESVLGPEEVKQNTMSLLQMILTCTGLPGHFPVDESCSDQTFTFWYLLQDELSMISEEDFMPLMEVFKPIFFSLIEVLLIKARFPSDSDYSSWSLEEKEQFRCYRQDIGDTMMYSYSILCTELLAQLVNCLMALTEMSKRATSQDWQDVEAVLFVFSSVSESVPTDEATHIPKLFSVIREIPFVNSQQISTALNMIGSFAEWMRWHPETLSSVLPLVLQGITNPEVGTAATIALKDITRENLSHLRPFAHQILVACQKSFEANVLKSRDLLRLMSSVGHVLSVMQTEEIMHYLDSMISPHIRHLEALAEMPPCPTNRADVHTTVNIFAWLFGSLDTGLEWEEKEKKNQQQHKQQENSDPIYVILQKISTAVQKIAYAWLFDTGIIEAVCDLYKKALQKLDNGFAPLSTDLTQLVINLYQRCPSTAIIDLCKQMLLMFGLQENFIPFSKAIIENVCVRSLQMFTTGIRNYTDVIEGFMCFLAQVMKKFKKIIMNCNCDLTAIFHAAVLSMALPEQATVKASCSFMIEFLNAGPENEVIKSIVTSRGHLLVDRIMRAIGGESQRGIVDFVADVIMALNKNYVAQLSVWLKTILENEGYPSPRASRQDKEQFIKNLLSATITSHRDRMNKRKTRDVVKEFTLLCRGLLGTEYAEAAATFL
ncbi:importin-13 isoform X2 [Aplysia californica]|uniref:Importin-13 n=1 Tax=Aplysia californica TaxID=6500 RepID=A0ABM1A268_APLCA|nr:importin-13 isoform X2 [Aplysia californica]